MITDEQKEVLQQFYLAMRKLVKSNTIPVMCAQRSFEETICGILGPNTWRATHISPTAMVEAIHGSPRNIQRAHGVLNDRMDRFDRTVKLLTEEEKSFDDWWSFYCYHDATVLITKEEHASNRRFTEADLVELPPREQGLFENSGFSFKMRKKSELAWINETMNAMRRAASH